MTTRTPSLRFDLYPWGQNNLQGYELNDLLYFDYFAVARDPPPSFFVWFLMQQNGFEHTKLTRAT